MPTNDANIIAGCIKGDTSAWNEFVERFSGLVMWSIKNRLSKSGYNFNNQDLQDIHQETFLSIYKENKLNSLKDRSKIAPWLSIVAGNIAMDTIRRVKGGVISEKTVPLSEDIDDADLKLSDILKDETPDAAEKMEQTEREITVRKAISYLSVREKIAINLHYANNNTLKEIALLLNMRLGSVSSLIVRARKKVRKNMHKNRLSYRHI